MARANSSCFNSPQMVRPKRWYFPERVKQYGCQIVLSKAKTLAVSRASKVCNLFRFIGTKQARLMSLQTACVRLVPMVEPQHDGKCRPSLQGCNTTGKLTGWG